MLFLLRHSFSFITRSLEYRIPNVCNCRQHGVEHESEKAQVHPECSDGPGQAVPRCAVELLSSRRGGPGGGQIEKWIIDAVLEEFKLRNGKQFVYYSFIHFSKMLLLHAALQYNRANYSFS